MSTPKIRDVLVEFEGEDLSKYGLFPLFIWYLNDVSQKKILRYGILERLPFSSTPEELHHFYHGRQTIEQFFKESTGPFNAGKMPSQEFRGNEAYLRLVTIAENCCVLSKKSSPFPLEGSFHVYH